MLPGAVGPVPATARVRKAFIGTLALANLAVWMGFFTPIQLLLPEQLEDITGDDGKVAALGWVSGAGALVAVIATPLIGLPGLAFYVAAVHLGLSKVVVPTTAAVQIPTSLLWSFANGFSEEIVVVMYLVTRLKQLGWKPWQFIAASAVLNSSGLRLK